MAPPCAQFPPTLGFITSLDVEEYQAGISFFSNRLITLYNEDGELPTETQSTEEPDTAES